MSVVDDQVLRMNASGLNYYRWLLSKIDIFKHEEHRTLVSVLFDRVYDCFIANDSNRKETGLYLRYVFEEETGYPISEYKEVGLNVPCSVLEMLVGLAMSIENDIMYDPEIGDRTAEWFWMMIYNLGLHKATNEEIGLDFRFGIAYIDHILNTWLDRTFDYDGTGSPFPLENPHEDQRKVEIWYQAMAYLDENFDI